MVARVELAALAALVSLASPVAAQAGGFYVREIGGRATALAGATSGLGGDASAVAHNPAGITGIEGLNLQLGGAAFFPAFDYFRRPVTDPRTGDTIEFAGVENSSSLLAAPFLGAATTFLGGDLGVGLGVFAPFGAGVDYPEDGAQRHVVTAIHLRTIFVSPTVAYRITRGLSTGFSVDYIYSDLQLRQRNALQFVTGDPEQFPDPDPSVEGSTLIEAKDTFTIGVRAGLRYQAESFSLGVAVHLPATLALEGDATVENMAITPLADASQPAGKRTDRVALEIPLPLIVNAGGTFRPHPALLLALDVSWQRWSAFEQLRVDFAEEHELLPTPGANLYDVVNENGWRDSLGVRFGAELTPIEGTPLAIRAGFFYDQSPIDDRHFDLLTPDSDKLGASAGIGWSFAISDGFGLDVDASFMHVALAEREVKPGATTVPGTPTPIPGSDRTILNKAAPSFFYGVTRGRVEIGYLTVGARL